MASLTQTCFFFSLIPVLLISASFSAHAQLSPSQSKTLLRLPHLLERPPALAGWSNATAFCYLPPSPSVSVSCSGNRVTVLTIVGGDRRSKPLSPAFSSNSLFTTLSRLPSLTSLTLVGLGLWGPLPGKVDRFDALKVLNLSSNFFFGAIPPEISTMSSLQALDLSWNYFNGTFPDFKSFHQLQHLDLSFNNLRSRIPATLFSLPSIQYLNLANNKLTGGLPAGVSCAGGLSYVDVSNNYLSGNPPSCINSNSSKLVLIISGNCLSLANNETQHSNSHCNLPALAAVLPPANNISGSKSNLGLILGIVGGVVGGVLLIGLLVFLVFRRARLEDAKAKSISQKPIGGLSSVQIDPRSAPADARRTSPTVMVETFGLTPYRMFTLEDLEEATNRFDRSNLIENSSRGQFYKGFLDDGSMIMVRCLKLKQKISPQSLYQCMDVVSKLRYRHLVSLLGHCLVNSQDGIKTVSAVFIVSECVSHGTLRSHITEWRRRGMLKWPQRVAALMGVARGVQFLHTVSVPGIVGNDLNIENIMLDKTLTAKISNYNLPVQSKKQKNKIIFESPFAEMEDKDYGSLERGQKEDIYQLGLILLEIILGKPTESKSQVTTLSAELQQSLTDSEESLKELIDPSIHGTFALESIRTAMELALKCVSGDMKERPSIDDVIWNLQYSIQVQDGWASSESLRL